jgi:hypothetical protein
MIEIMKNNKKLNKNQKCRFCKRIITDRKEFGVCNKCYDEAVAPRVPYMIGNC